MTWRHLVLRTFTNNHHIRFFFNFFQFVDESEYAVWSKIKLDTMHFDGELRQLDRYQSVNERNKSESHLFDRYVST